MFLFRTKLLYWGLVILFGLTSILGDALHWIPGIQCSAHRHCSSQHEMCEHQHQATCSHAHQTKDSITLTASIVRSRTACDSDCLICRWLTLQIVVSQVYTQEISAPLVAHLPPMLSPRIAVDIPRCAAPRGPPTLIA